MQTLFDPDDFLTRYRLDVLPSLSRYLSSELTDDYLLEKLDAAVADAQRELHVFLEPTAQFPDTPTDTEIDALDGMPWAIDPGYDYDSDLIQPGGWTFLALRQKPIIALESIVFSYPSMGTVFRVPPNWIRMDRKYGHVRFIPASNAFTTPMGGFMASAMGMQSAPQFIEVRYTAGLQDVTTTYPDLVDLIKKMVTYRLMTDMVVPASGSISADGLSRSISAPDMDKMQGWIDSKLETLRKRIHGVTMMVL